MQKTPTETAAPTRARAPKPRKDGHPPALKMDARRKAQFLEELKKYGTVTHAAHAIGVNRCTVNEHRARDPEFDAACDDVQHLVTERMEQSIYQRGCEGWLEPVFGRVDKDQDDQIGVIRKYSDSCAALYLKARRPEVYRDKLQAEVTSTTKVVMVVPPRAASEDEWVALAGAAKKDES